MTTVLEFEGLLSQLTMYELNELHTQLYTELNNAPIWDTGATKAKQVSNFTYWVRHNKGTVTRVMELAKLKIAEKKMVPKGLAEGTKHITKEELESTQGYTELIEALEFPFKAGKCDPFTRDGKHVSVAAIYNMSAWANWKSSSISDYERAKAGAVDALHLGDLMSLNKGRRIDQPALFPAMGLLR